jgi:hypothetical protein
MGDIRGEQLFQQLDGFFLLFVLQVDPGQADASGDLCVFEVGGVAKRLLGFFQAAECEHPHASTVVRRSVVRGQFDRPLEIG